MTHRIRSFRRLHALAVVVIVGVAFGAFASQAAAVPLLQLYIEGAEYDTEKKGWVLEPDEGEEPPTSIRLWAIGNVGKWEDDLESVDPITGVHLAIAYSNEFGELDFRFESANTEGHGEFWQGEDTEPLTQPTDPTRTDYWANDDPDDIRAPQLSDESDLPSHGEYKEGVAWQEFALLDFDMVDYQMANFDEDFNFDEPDLETNHFGQIKVYEISIFPDQDLDMTGQTMFHFDLYNSKAAGNSKHTQAWFAPFSHDAEGDLTVVPTPSAALGAGASPGLLGRRRGTPTRAWPLEESGGELSRS